MTFSSQGLHGDEIDFENTWVVIEAAFREIHTKNASRLSYEELYRHAYRIVLKKKGEELYKKVHDFEKKWLSNEVRGGIQQLLSPNLLANSQSVGGTTANERRVTGEKFLKGLKQAWGDHQVCMSMLADVLMYMVSFASTSLLLRLGIGTLTSYITGPRILPGPPPALNIQCRIGSLPRRNPQLSHLRHRQPLRTRSPQPCDSRTDPDGA